MVDLAAKYAIKKRGGKKQFFHSSAFGSAQSGDNIGAASVESYAKRREIEKKRNRTVGKYSASDMGNMFNGLGAKQYTPPAESEGSPTPPPTKPNFGK